jgi:hypothetical protein
MRVLSLARDANRTREISAWIVVLGNQGLRAFRSVPAFP